MPGFTDLDRRLLEPFFEPPYIVIDEAGHWLWQGPTNKDGYGVLVGQGVYRVSYMLFVGPIERGMTIDHVCRVRLCCNPDPRHLEKVTHAENNRRAMEYVQQYPGERVHQAAKRWCKWGHPYSEENTGRDKRGRRFCYACRRRWAAEHRARAGQDRRGSEWRIDPVLFEQLTPLYPPVAGEPVYGTRDAAAFLAMDYRVMAAWMQRHPEFQPPSQFRKRREWPESLLRHLEASRRHKPWSRKR